MTGTRLDRINLRILEERQRNGHISTQELAERVALSPSACLARDLRQPFRLDPFQTVDAFQFARRTP
jgi:hypothetical protein